MPNKKYIGKIVNERTTYGFIECEGLAEHVFYHISSCVPEEQLQKNDIVEFELGEGRDGRQRAFNVHIVKEEEDVGTKPVS